MLNERTRALIFKAGVMSFLAVTASGVQSFQSPSILAQASPLGEVTITANRLWSYSEADWSARVQVLREGESFSVVERVEVSEAFMYRLSNGRYVTANPAFVAFEEVAPREVAAITTANLNLRTGPGTGNTIIATMPIGSNVVILSEEGGWSKVQYGTTTGYASNDFLRRAGGDTPVISPAPSSPAPTHTPSNASSGSVKVNLNLRSGAGVQHDIVTVMPAGAEVRILSAGESGWIEIEFNGRRGFAAEKYIESEYTSPEAPTPIPTPSPAVSTATTTARLNLRAGAGESHRILITMPLGAKIAVLGREGAWVRVEYEEREGYAHENYLRMDQSSIQELPQSGGIVEMSKGKTTAPLNMREGPGVAHGVLRVLPIGAEVMVLSESNHWSHISVDGVTGYVASRYVEKAAPLTIRERALELALTQIGKPYVWGAMGPDAFDCSGLVQWAYNALGYFQMPRTTNAQYLYGRRVSRENVARGDLVYFINNRASGALVDHVGIYMGNGTMLHAPAPGRSVEIAAVDWSRMVTIRQYGN